ncbi:hypothetical protein [Streptococcus mitis]
MGLIKAITDSIGGTFADQWKEIITVHAFDEHTAVSESTEKIGLLLLMK